MTFPVHDWHLNADYGSDARQHLGRIPLLVDPTSADPIWLQVQTNYPRGWNPVLGDERTKWTLTPEDYLLYPGLPPLAPAATAFHGDVQMLVYPAGWFVVVEPNQDFTLARIEP